MTSGEIRFFAWIRFPKDSKLLCEIFSHLRLRLPDSNVSSRVSRGDFGGTAEGEIREDVEDGQDAHHDTLKNKISQMIRYSHYNHIQNIEIIIHRITHTI
jgi:hypothetical protein